MNSITKGFGVLALSAAIALGASGCSQNAPAAAPSPTVDATQLTGAKAAESIKGFVAAGTSDEVAKAVADKATAETFAPAVKFLDKDAETATVQNTVSDFVLVKMADPKAAVSVDVDESKVVVDGQKAAPRSPTAMSLPTRSTIWFSVTVPGLSLSPLPLRPPRALLRANPQSSSQLLPFRFPSQF
jgi:hypothetical protein